METPVGLDTKWLGRLLKKNYKDNEPVDILSYQVESAVPKGENYMSNIFRIKMSVLTEDGSKKTMSMIVKAAKSSREAARVVQGFALSRWETMILTTTLRQMEGLMAEFEDTRDTLWPKIYGFEPYSIIVMEDLKETSFSLVDRRRWVDLDHSLLVLRSIGRYHAMSKVLMGRGLVDEGDKGHYYAGPKNAVKNSLFGGALHMLSKAILNKLGFWPAGWEDIGMRLKHQVVLLPDTMEYLYTDYDKKFDVLNHGDVRTTNMLFRKMEYTNIPTAVKFVDYQHPHINSFIWDVTYFMYSSIKPSIRRANLDLLLEAYHESLADNLKFFKWQGFIPSLEDVRSEAARLRPAALAFLTTLMPLMAGDTEEPLIMENLITHPPEEIYAEVIFTEEKFVREIKDDLKDFVKLEVI